jgi:hypothetical protein
MIIVTSIIVSTLIVFVTPTQTSAIIIDHIENGQREIYDTEDPTQQGCELTTMICWFPPNGSGLPAVPPDVLSQPQPQQNRINWLELCLNPLVDYVITEDCHTLTTPDGHTLTSEGQRVLKCLAAGALVGILAPEVLGQIRQQGPAVNCGGQGATSLQ